MPTQDGRIVRYDYNDPADLAYLIETGLVWRGPAAAKRLAVEALIDGEAEVNEFVPEDARTFIMEEQRRRYTAEDDGGPTTD